MSAKQIIGGILLIAAIALPVIGAAALGISAIALGAISAGLAIAGNMLIGPAVPKMPASLADGGRDRLYSSLDPTAPRKILFGDTAGATDVRYQTFTGVDQEYMEQILCVASHEVNDIYEIWLDNEMAWSLSGGVVAKFTGFLTVNTRDLPTSGNGIAIDTVWTATATLTGCAYVRIKYLLIRDDGNGGNDSPFGGGVTNRMTIRVRGALVYDPRLDTTVTGGSGTQRANNQATWVWNADASRNPAIQLLFFMLGWRINSVLAVGMGLPMARIDLPSFITAANACDESVTKAAGGTEPRYRSDGIVTEADDRNAIVEQLCATMNAVVRDSGGKLSIYVLHNDLATPVASFTEHDVLGSMEWSQTNDLSSSFNITRGRRIDPSNEALYQPVDYPEVKLTSRDGIDRIDSVDYPLVQSNGQAQRLAKQRLQRSQYQGRLSLTGKPSFWQVSVGNVIQFSHPSYGWVNKLFRVVGQKISRTGETEAILVEENAAIYAWDNNEAPSVQPGVPTTYDAVANGPIQKPLNEAAGSVTTAMASINAITSDSVLDKSEKAQLIPEVESIIDEKPGIDAQADVHGITTLKTTYGNKYTNLIDYLNARSPAWNDTTQDTTIVRATFNLKFEEFYLARQDLLNKMFDVAGATSVVIDPVNDVLVYANSDGTIKAGQLPRNVALTASIGTAAITTSGTWSRTITTGITCTIGAATGNLNVTAVGVGEASVPVSFVYNGVTRSATVHIVRQKDPPTADGGGGTGGTTASTTTLGDTAGTAYNLTTAVSATLTAKAGSVGQVQCKAPIDFMRLAGSVNPGETGVLGKWQWRVVGGSWADITTEVAHTWSSSTLFIGGNEQVSQGSVSVTHTKTALTNGTNYEFRFLWRRTNISGEARNVYRVNGTMEAIGT